MSNLRSDCRAIVEQLPSGDLYKVHIEALCNQIDTIEECWHASNKRIAKIRDLLEGIVITEGCDKGVVLLSNDGTTHKEVHGGKTVNVYDHEHFSPLGDALIAAWDWTWPDREAK